MHHLSQGRYACVDASARHDAFSRFKQNRLGRERRRREVRLLLRNNRLYLCCPKDKLSRH